MRKVLFVALSAALVAFAGAASAQTAPLKIGKSAKGRVLTNASGMTLYTFDKDKNGKSACYGACAFNWPPAYAFLGAQPNGRYSLAARTDGGSQWAYKGKPLYTWAKDQRPGDITGDGVNKVWHIARP